MRVQHSSGTCLIATAFVGSAIAQSNTVTSATITEIADGIDVFIQNRRVRVNATARRQEQVRTGEARAELRFNNQAIARLGRNSLLTIGQCGAQVQRGSMLANGAVPSCSSQIATAVRGTTYLFEIDDDGEERISVLEGEVEIRRLQERDDDREEDDDDDRRQPKRREQVFRVGAGNRFVRARRNRRTFVVVRAIGEREFDDVLTGQLFRGFRRNLPAQSIDRIETIYRQRFPNRRFPLRQAVLNPHRGHFTLTVQQDRPQFPQVLVRVSLASRRSNGYLPERFVGDFLLPVNRPVEFIRGLNPADRAIVRIFDPQGLQLLGYSELELLDDRAAAFVILPDRREQLGIVRTVIGIDSDRDRAIDRTPSNTIYSYFTELENFKQDYFNARALYFQRSRP